MLINFIWEDWDMIQAWFGNYQFVVKNIKLNIDVGLIKPDM